MLLYIQCVVNLDTGEATDDLQPQAIKLLQQLGSNCTTVSQVIESEDKAVFKAIQDGIDRYNTHHLISNAQKVKLCVRVHSYVRVRSYVHGTCVCAYVHGVCVRVYVRAYVCICMCIFELI